LAKLQFYGWPKKNCALYNSYLTNRYQRTVILNSNGYHGVSNWVKITNCVPHGSVLGPLLFLVSVNDLPMFIHKKVLPVLFADDTSIIFAQLNIYDLKANIGITIDTINKWLKIDILPLNLDKSCFIHFITNQNTLSNLQIDYQQNQILTKTHIKALGITIDNKLSCSIHIDLLQKKLNTVCILTRNVKPYMTEPTLIMIYHSPFHSSLSYGIMVWGNFSYANKIFKLLKRVIPIMVGYGYRTSCRTHFKSLKILPLRSQYVYSLLNSVVKNKNYFTSNANRHNFYTRERDNLHYPQVNLALYRNRAYYSGLKLFNALPPHIKNISDNFKNFKKGP
jgi:hypothetical protein